MKALLGTAQLVRVTTTVAGSVIFSFTAMDKTGASSPYNYAVASGSGVVTNVTTATTTTILTGSATANLERNITELTVSCPGAANGVTIEQFDGTTANACWKGTMLTGERVVFDETGAWTYYAADGTQRLSSGPGAYIGTTVLTAASGNFTTGANTRTIRVRQVAGGGGGGGANTAATSAAVGSGGAAGGYVEKTFAVQPSTAYAYVNGAAGAAGAAAGGNGTAGGNSTFIVSGTTITAFGGNLGTGSAAAATALTIAGGTATAISTNGDVNGAGAPGGTSERHSATIAESGHGGSGIFGAGGAGRIAQGAGLAGTGFGAGGSGGCCINGGAAAAGAVGTAGLTVVEEFT